jgi:HK97 family phage prohead protease
VDPSQTKYALFRLTSVEKMPIEGEGVTKRFKFVASTSDRDRYGDIIEQEGWDLTAFRANPVFLWAHDSKNLPPIGKVPDSRIENGALVIEVEFDEEDPFAAMIRSKYERGFLHGVSVGFKPREYTKMDDGGYRYLECDLMEVSAVPVPANPMALQLAADDKETKMLRDWAETVLRSIDADDEAENVERDALVRVQRRLDALEAMVAKSGDEQQPQPEETGERAPARFRIVQ